MSIRKSLTALILSGMTLIPAVSQATPSAPSAAPRAERCFLQQHRVTAVMPYSVDQQIGHASTKVVRGADIYILAEPGLTAEWLRLSLARQIAAMPAGMRDCAFDVKDVEVRVGSAGPGFEVKLIAPDSKKGEEVLRRARLLVQ